MLLFHYANIEMSLGETVLLFLLPMFLVCEQNFAKQQLLGCGKSSALDSVKDSKLSQS